MFVGLWIFLSHETWFIDGLSHGFNAISVIHGLSISHLKVIIAYFDCFWYLFEEWDRTTYRGRTDNWHLCNIVWFAWIGGNGFDLYWTNVERIVNTLNLLNNRPFLAYMRDPPIIKSSKARGVSINSGMGSANTSLALQMKRFADQSSWCGN